MQLEITSPLRIDVPFTIIGMVCNIFGDEVELKSADLITNNFSPLRFLEKSLNFKNFWGIYWNLQNGICSCLDHDSKCDSSKIKL